MKKNICCLKKSSMKLIESISASEKVIIAFIHLHTVKIRDTRKLTNITKRRKMSLLLIKCLNI